MPAPAGRKDDDTPEAAARALREESAPAAKPKSSLWQALANLSIGRSTDREKSADIVDRKSVVEGKSGELSERPSRRRHTRCLSDWSSDVCSSDLAKPKSSLWQALANLSIGRSTDREKSAAIVHKGETVTLNEEIGRAHV